MNDLIYVGLTVLFFVLEAQKWICPLQRAASSKM